MDIINPTDISGKPETNRTTAVVQDQAMCAMTPAEQAKLIDMMANEITDRLTAEEFTFIMDPPGRGTYVDQAVAAINEWYGATQYAMQALKRFRDQARAASNL